MIEIKVGKPRKNPRGQLEIRARIFHRRSLQPYYLGLLQIKLQHWEEIKAELESLGWIVTEEV